MLLRVLLVSSPTTTILFAVLSATTENYVKNKWGTSHGNRVAKSAVGFMGGKIRNPSYEQV